MKVSITIHMDTDGLSVRDVSDEYLAQLWHVAQANPAPHGDSAACALVKDIGDEILRRWLSAQSPVLYHHQAGDTNRKLLQEHGHWKEMPEGAGALPTDWRDSNGRLRRWVPVPDPLPF